MTVKQMNRRFLWFVTLGVCISILVAGLWPFRFHPENGVSWLARENGVRFQGRGIVYSEDGILSGGPASIEIWLRPESRKTRGVPRILSFNDGSHELFYIGQWKTGLVLRSITRSRIGRETYKDVGAGEIFPDGHKSFVTVTMDASGTGAYLDGRPARSFPGFAPLARDKGVPLYPVLGTSPTGYQCWDGELFALAVYDRVLSPYEVSQSYLSWKEHGRPGFSGDKGPIALYLFNEHAGTVVRNHQGAAHQLLVPPEFQPLVRTVLVPPWQDFKFNWTYIKDVLVNLAGFVPFGFFVSALLLDTTRLSRRKAFIAVILLGAAVSLSIELTQVYIPGRDSQLSDVIDNTLGTVIGTMLFARISRRGSQ